MLNYKNMYGNIFSLRKVFVCCILFVFFENAVSQTEVSVFSVKDVIKNKTGWAYWFIPPDGIADTLSVKMSYVDVGMGTHPPHQHYEDELFYLLGGTAIVHLNGEESVITPGDAFYAPGNASHSISRINEAQPILYAMFKRETVNGLKEPYLPGKEKFTIKDCIYNNHNDEITLLSNVDSCSFCCLSKKMSGNGLNATFNMGKKHQKYSFSEKEQTVLFVLDGIVRVRLNNRDCVLGNLSSVYIAEDSNCEIEILSDSSKYLIVKTK